MYYLSHKSLVAHTLIKFISMEKAPKKISYKKATVKKTLLVNENQYVYENPYP